MNRILLADDSAHAQRMGEFILREEGYEVVSVTDGETALARLSDVDPDLVVADALMPHRSGYQICEFIKSSPRLRHIRVVLTAGALEPWNPEEAERVGADGFLQKPFEASVMIELVKPLIESAHAERPDPAVASAETPDPPAREVAATVENSSGVALAAAATASESQAAVQPDTVPAAEPVRLVAAPNGAAPPDPERIRAAVTLAMDDAMSDIIDKITEKVLIALNARQ